MACVFLFSTDDDGNQPWPDDDGEAWLAPDERSRARNMTGQDAKRRYIRSVFALRSLLSEAGVPRIVGRPFRRGTHSKPDNLGDVHFNLARSHDVVLIGLNDGPIGVDIERTNRPSRFFPGHLTANWLDQYPALASQLAPTDLMLHGTDLDKHCMLLRAWTRLEAQVKCNGQSLAQVLDQTDPLSTSNNPTYVTDIEAPKGLVAACALLQEKEIRLVVGRALAMQQ